MLCPSITTDVFTHTYIVGTEGGRRKSNAGEMNWLRVFGWLCVLELFSVSVLKRFWPLTSEPIRCRCWCMFNYIYGLLIALLGSLQTCNTIVQIRGEAWSNEWIILTSGASLSFLRNVSDCQFRLLPISLLTCFWCLQGEENKLKTSITHTYFPIYIHRAAHSRWQRIHLSECFDKI